MTRPERTSARVARIAGKVMAIKIVRAGTTVPGTTVTWSDIRALAASALTQTANRKRPAGPATIKGKVPSAWPQQRVLRKGP